MEKLKVAVYTADRDNGNVQAALIRLQAYVTAHMNTNLSTSNGAVYPPIQLQNTYLKQAPSEAGLYTQAQSYCQQLDPTDFSGRNRVPCIEQFITSHGSTTEPALYQFDFISPAWSPDAAGFSLLATVALLFISTMLLAVRLWRKFIT